MKRKASGALAALAGVGALTSLSCASLPDIERGSCGNQIVDPGEDCDTFPEGLCGRKGTPTACRFDCSPDPDGDRNDCPAGYGCGADSICRAGDWDFALAGVVPSDLVVSATAADFDGDGGTDLFVAGSRGFAIHFLEAGGEIAKTVEVPASGSTAAVGDLSADGRADLAFPLSQSLALNVLRGQSNRTVAATAYSSKPIPGGASAVKFVTLEAMPAHDVTSDTWGREILLVADRMVTNVANEVALYELPVSAADVAGEIQVGRIDEGLPCDQFVLAAVGGSEVDVFSPCRRGANGQAGWNIDESEAMPPVRLPAGVGVGREGVLLVPLDGDAHLDLLIATDEYAPYVAYGVGDGTFDSQPVTAPSGPGDGAATPADEMPGVPFELPLAVGHLDDDPASDFVLAYGILFNGSDGQFLPNVGEPWTAARIADFNGNGLADVIAFSAGSPNLDFLNGAGGGRFNHFVVPTQASPRSLAIGDFDGDLLNDVAIVEGSAGASAPRSPDLVSILYGEPAGAPRPPVTVGAFASVDGIGSGTLPAETLDGIDDLVVATRADREQPEPKSLAQFHGSTDRRLQSPFFFEGVIPLRPWIGEFDGDEGRHPDLAVLATEAGLDAPVGSPGGRDPVGGVPGPAEGEGVHLWLLPSSGDAALDPGAATRGAAFPPTFLPDGGLAAPIDLDLDGTDEIVFLAPYDADPTGEALPAGGVAIARVDRSSGRPTWVLDPSIQETEETYFRSLAELGVGGDLLGSGGSGGSRGEPAPPDGSGTGGEGVPPPEGPPLDSNEIDPLSVGGRVEVVDVDGDDVPDIVASGVTYDSSFLPRFRIVVFFNPGDGTLDVEKRKILDVGVAAPVLTFATIEADQDDDPEIVLVTTAGSYLADLDVWADALTPAPVGVTPGSVLAAGDFDHDGVRDLAVGGTDGLTIYRGVPKIQ